MDKRALGLLFLKNASSTTPTQPQGQQGQVLPVQQPLPYLAVSRTPKGEPYFGPGAFGAVRKLFSNMFNASQYQEGLTQEKRNQIHETASNMAIKDAENVDDWLNNSDFGKFLMNASVNIVKATGPTAEIGLGVTPGTEKNVPSIKEQVQQFSEGWRETFASLRADKSQIPHFALKTTGTTLWSILEAFNAVTTVSEGAIAYRQGLIDVAGANNVLAVPTSPLVDLPEGVQQTGTIKIGNSEYAVNYNEAYKSLQHFGSWAGNMANALNVPQLAFALMKIRSQHEKQGLGLFEFTPEEQKVLDEKRAEGASQMLYGGWFWQTEMEEYKRRYWAGEDPVALQEEIGGTPQFLVPEIAGQMIFDPTNLIPFGGAKELKFASSADELLVVRDERVLQAIGEISKAQNDVDAIAIARKYFDAHELEQMASKFDDLARDYRMVAGTSSAKQFVTQRKAFSVLEVLEMQTKDHPEDMAEFVKAMINSMSRDADVAADAYSTLAKSPMARMFWSEDGKMSRYLLARMVEDGGDGKGLAKFLQNIEAHSDSAEHLVEFSKKLITRSTEDILPSVDELAKARKLVDAGETDARLVRLASQYDELKPSVLYFNRINNSLRKGVAGVGYDTLNRFFSSVYMGASPAYAIRNLMQDSLHLTVDMGPQTGVKGLISGATSLFGPGAVMKRSMKDIEEHFGRGVLDEALRGKGVHAAEEATETITRKFDFRKFAENGESSSSVTLIHDSLFNTMDKWVRQGGLPNTSELIAAGLPKENADHLLRLVIDNHGNVKKSISIFRNELKAGRIEAWRTRQISERLSKFLNSGETKLYERWQEVLQAKSPAEARRLRDELVNDILDKGSETARQIPRARDIGDPELRKAMGAIEDAVHNSHGVLREADDDLMRAVVIAFGEQRAKVQSAMNKISRTLYKDIGLTGLPDAQIIEQFPQFGKLDDLTKIGADYTERWWNFSEEVNRISKNVTQKNFLEMANEVPEISGRAFTDRNFKTVQEFKDALWKYYRSAQPSHWLEANGKINSQTQVLLSSILSDPIFAKMGRTPDELLQNKELVDAFEMFMENFELAKAPNLEAYTLGNKDMARKIASLFGVSTISGDVAAGATGANRDKALLSILNGGLEDAQKKLTVDEFTPEEVIKALTRHNTEHNLPIPNNSELKSVLGTNVIRPAPVADTVTPTHAMAIYQNSLGFVGELNKEFDNFIADWGRTTGGFTNKNIEAALTRWETEGASRELVARAKAMMIAREKRDFALHAYSDRTYLDLAASFIFPYQYWYSRTYAKWAQRLVLDPEIISAYAKYRRALERIHAGLPEWWKYNISSNDLLGLESDNPIYFNLESSLNPMQGMMGVDYNDPEKRATWYSRIVDDMGKFGPTTFTPINWIVAAALYENGENEAASRWMGRLIPQTATLKSALYLTNIKTGVPYNELDPFVQAFSGGLDSNERKRVGRELGAWVDEAPTEQERLLRAAQAQEAAHTQSGELWNEAVNRSQDRRAPGQMLSFIFGTGFKARTQTDIQIDNMYNEYYGLMTARPNMSPRAFQETMAALSEKYPWMDAVLISRRPGDERDAAYIYSVLSRIPPGQMNDLAEVAGINGEMINNFYDTKGTFEGMTKQDHERFMAGIVDLGVLLKIPARATRQEWAAAKEQYSTMQTTAKQIYGDNIYDIMDEFYAIEDDNLRKQFKAQHPEIDQLFSFENAYMTGTPLLYKYYGGIDTLERYYSGLMYDELDKLYPNASQKFLEYGELGSKAFYRKYPELRNYSADKARLQDEVNRNIVRMASILPDGTEIPVREDFTAQGQNQENLLNATQQTPQITWDEWQTMLPSYLTPLLYAYWTSGVDLTKNARSELDYYSGKLGYENGDALLRAVGRSLVNP